LRMLARCLIGKCVKVIESMSAIELHKKSLAGYSNEA
jgi:hypothetical protein